VPRILIATFTLTLLSFSQEQQVIKPADPSTQVRVNYLNVCTPTADDEKELATALARVPEKPKFSADFEISRGRTSIEGSGQARYVRLRRDMPEKSGFSTTQYSLSTDTERTTETLVLRLADPKDLLMITLEDQVSATATSPSVVLETDTPVSRIKLERFGKPSLVLARCENADQATYETYFQQSSRLMAAFRRSLGLRGIFRSDLLWLAHPPAKAAAAKPEKPPATK
jgi:hypothetical protein